MHELLLFAQIPPAQHSHLLSILTGIAAMQPQPFLERHLVFKPTRTPGSPRSGPVEASVEGISEAALHAFRAQTRGDTFYVQLVGGLKVGKGKRMKPEKDHNNNNNPTDETAAATAQDPPQNWTLQFRDLPEVAVRRPVTSRLIADYPVQTTDPVTFMSHLGFTPTTSFHTSGHRLTHLSTSFTLFRPLLFSPSPPSSPPPPSSPRLLVDPSGTYLLQVSVKVQDGSKPELLGRGISELAGVKELLKGVVELGVGERLSLDSRVR